MRTQADQEPVTPWEVEDAELQRVMKAWGVPSLAVQAFRALAQDAAETDPPDPETPEEPPMESCLPPRPRCPETKAFWKAVRESQARAQRPISFEM